MSLQKKIGSVQFELASEDLIRKLSVAEIKDPTTYSDDGYPVVGGLMDPRLGVIDPGIKCKICNGRMSECLGHIGHIELIRPVVHIGYAKEIFRILELTCRKCGKLKFTEDEKKKFKEAVDNNKDLAMKIESEVKKRNEESCRHCGEEPMKIKFVKPYSYYYLVGKEEEYPILITDIEEWLKKIKDEDMEYLRIRVRPENMILRALPVMSILSRPSITLESSTRSEDDLTHKLVDILRINERIKATIDSGAPQIIIEDLWNLLQYHVATYFDNELSGVPPARHRSGRPLKTICQRLKGKEGRFRNNLSGKRVNFSARTVISPDPNIDIDELGVPELIAKEMSVPERANEYNIEILRKYILNGGNYPGASKIVTGDGKSKRILEINKEELAKGLNAGDLVERHIMNGDIVIFNRQPSLHIVSMMCHKVRIMKGRTFRINPAVCAPYNADFDGDEMNMHVCQSEEAVVEEEVLMKINQHIISPRYGGPIIGGRHDHVSGTYLLSNKEKISRETALQITGGIVELPEEKADFTGKEIFSLLLPKDINVAYVNKFNEKIIIEDGKLKEGSIDAESMAGELIMELFNKYGADAAADFINKSTRMAIRVLEIYGLTLGIDSTDMKGDAVQKINNLLDEAENKIAEYIIQKEKGELKPIVGKSLEDALEDYIMIELSKARDKCGKIAASSLVDTTPIIMAKTGARGSLLNVTQMSATVGQQAVRGKRIKRGYIDRTLSSFKRHDFSPSACGFVRSSFKDGISPTEYFFHAMGGRETLVDTAIRTGRSGYLQRRLINSLLDLKVDENRAVRDSGGNIIQFLYGEDGVDVSRKTLLYKKEKDVFEWFS
ncbi:MAG: DNA-directed RNA polymerase subunit A' [Candidatus Altiarchaeum hamiconexum]|uniref:DNA-directed RNA polymerase subunit n=1 Tax=Candidatus Altarchaeum hamiconexum TaxID=1803513 RepID=A0A8J7YUG4_9ARCH|nr:DNA-directed RNA polymerase subunit A' [Candidatus Altarchaeum hamiconexum]OIQ04597.1 MAG: DNA-directed RNA polymerase subunit A' [Candidatus Altarchaeum sp. CG2_30_32_3053]PIN67442.1 MAG: DNA-directed RNA polymerase subunit A' [Candidatus Altarchaeum sp. CG12_big_fil_rev_8_21_14_0_65_33_22]PIV27796.1 MAG: DNA-directed RNA polymerase subunit A' [Candidatus Altarchaeum sp. CG03_land_8_20_14_0_80_32_618]PIX49067.1 MAG: DNA-directed RNA polymerase subunit A' [Candidatus Altarchaeum sp. CG_4_8_1